MKQRYLEVTFRNGKPLPSAYLYLPRGLNEKSVRTEGAGHGMVIDYGPQDDPIGIQMTKPTDVTLDRLNQALTRLNLPPMQENEFAPLADDLISWIERLAGQKVPFPDKKTMLKHDPFTGKENAKDNQKPGRERKGIGYSQLNEILLTLGYDRITPAFFAYLFGEQSTVDSHRKLAEGIDKFRKHAMLLYGNVKFGFKTLSCLDKTSLQKKLKPLLPIPVSAYKNRHAPLHNINAIDGKQTYYLGHIIERDINDKLTKDPNNAALHAEAKNLEQFQSIGRKNHEAYLTYDHMDVYIATSMRQRHEFYFINRFVKELFSRKELKDLTLRWFDPTQAFCKERIDKGLVEGLMVKRATCTIYHSQETETLGKDSELAATLAQGKPVVAFVPKLENRDEFKSGAQLVAKEIYHDKSLEELIRIFLPLYYPEFWRDKDEKVRGWACESEQKKLDIGATLDLLFEKAREMYDRKATQLSEWHPLGLQVNLATGVTNGVLVVRKVAQCAKLLRRILLNDLEFDIKEKVIEDRVYLLLIEKISGCVYRVVTGDELLTNSFWNFYLEDSPDFMAQHSLTDEEHKKIVEVLGWEPNLTDLGLSKQ